MSGDVDAVPAFQEVHRARAPRWAALGLSGAGALCPGDGTATRWASPGMMTRMSEAQDADVGRAPICPSCGVTALPAETSNVIYSAFVCENPDCDAFGDTVES